MGALKLKNLQYTYDNYKLWEGDWELNDLKAKVYKLDFKEYDRQGDFTKETYNFEDTLCNVKIDFEKVFRRFRK